MRVDSRYTLPICNLLEGEPSSFDSSRHPIWRALCQLFLWFSLTDMRSNRWRYSNFHSRESWKIVMCRSMELIQSATNQTCNCKSRTQIDRPYSIKSSSWWSAQLGLNYFELSAQRIYANKFQPYSTGVRLIKGMLWWIYVSTRKSWEQLSTVKKYGLMLFTRDWRSTSKF